MFGLPCRLASVLVIHFPFRMSIQLNGRLIKKIVFVIIGLIVVLALITHLTSPIRIQVFIYEDLNQVHHRIYNFNQSHHRIYNFNQSTKKCCRLVAQSRQRKLYRKMTIITVKNGKRQMMLRNLMMLGILMMLLTK